MNAIVVNVSRGYWSKYWNSEEGILQEWDKHDRDVVHFKLPNKPQTPFNYVIIWLEGRLRGCFEKRDVKELDRDYLEHVKLAEDFEPGWFVICYGKNWRRFPKEYTTPLQRGFYYTNLSVYL